MDEGWRHIGGLVGGVLIYERGPCGAPTSRAYLVAEPDGVCIVGFDGDSPPERQALEQVVHYDLETRFGQVMLGNLGGPTASLRDVLSFHGVSSTTAIKTNRGRHKRGAAELREFAMAYIESGDRRGRKRRQVLELMRQAELAGHVKTTRTPGRPNGYELLEETDAAVDPVVPGDRERAEWFEVRRFADVLEANWQRQVVRRSRAS